VQKCDYVLKLLCPDIEAVQFGGHVLVLKLSLFLLSSEPSVLKFADLRSGRIKMLLANSIRIYEGVLRVC